MDAVRASDRSSPCYPAYYTYGGGGGAADEGRACSTAYSVQPGRKQTGGRGSRAGAEIFRRPHPITKQKQRWRCRQAEPGAPSRVTASARHGRASGRRERRIPGFTSQAGRESGRSGTSRLRRTLAQPQDPVVDQPAPAHAPRPGEAAATQEEEGERLASAGRWKSRCGPKLETSAPALPLAK